MTIFDAFLLGLVQGLTEFLPISSDGHLALAEMALGAERLRSAGGGLLFTLLIHLATMSACIAWFRREIWALHAALKPGPQTRAARHACLLVIVASVPTAAIGFALKSFVEGEASLSKVVVGLGFLGTALALGSTQFVRPQEDGPAPGPGAWLDELLVVRLRDAILMGVAQGLAVLPGLSRSGSTIAAGLWLGLPPGTAARFSLLMSLPAIGGAFLLELHDAEPGPIDARAWVLGFAVSFIVGFLAIGWLVAIARKGKLIWFAGYTALLGAALVVMGLMGR